ncbi:MAG: hypothetical protein RLZZ626_871 [Actinomycetota bacterium]
MTKQRSKWIGLIFISMAISLVIIDGTIVNTIFPTVIKALNIQSDQVQWVQESYVLVFASLLLVWGSLADRIGRRLVLVMGIAIFIAASWWAGTTTSVDQMIIARIVQGIGGSMVLPTTLSLVNANFQGKQRGQAFAVWGATIGGMVAVGPVLGGWLASYETIWGFDGWRWAFNINLPLGLIVIAGLLWWVTESKQEQRAGGIDVVGAGISVVMFLTLVFGLIEGRVYGWWNVNSAHQFNLFGIDWPTTGLSVIPVSLAISVVFIILFVVWEHHREKAHKNVLLDLGLFKIASFRNGSIAALIISMGEFGVLFAIPLWLQNVEGLTPLQSGTVLLWLAGGAFVASGVGGALSGKLAPAMAVRIGVALELVGVVGIAFVSGYGWGAICPFLFVYGVGIGFATAQLTGVIMVDVPLEKSGQGSGSQSTVRQVGSALGIAVLGTALFTATQASIDSKLADIPAVHAAPAAAYNWVSSAVVESAGGAIPTLKATLEAKGSSAETATAVAEAAQTSFTEGAKATAWTAAGFLLLGLASTFNLNARRKHGAKREE